MNRWTDDQNIPAILCTHSVSLSFLALTACAWILFIFFSCSFLRVCYWVKCIVRKYARLIVNVLMNRSFTWNEINLKCICGRSKLSMLIKLLNKLTCLLLFSLLLISSHFIIADSNVGFCSFWISTDYYARSVFL